jgi:hypothetical protein
VGGLHSVLDRLNTNAIACDRCGSSAGLVFRRFNDDGGAIGEDFGDAADDLVGVVADGDDGVGAKLRRVERHHSEGILAGLLAELGEESNVATDESLQASANGGEDVAGTDDDAADDTDVANDAVTGNFEGGGDEGGVD